MTSPQANPSLGALLKLMHSPDLLVNIGRAAVKRRITAPFDSMFRAGTSNALTRIDLKLTNACNLRCKMCGQWGETGWHVNQPASFIRELVPLETYKRMADEVAPYKPWISIWGGEPFLYPDLIPLLACFKEKGFAVTLSTNGLTLAKEAERIVDLGVDFLYVSIDGPREIHDSVRGLKGAFDRTTAGIRAVQEQKRLKGRAKPFIVTVAAANKENAHIFDSVCEVTEDVKADAFLGCYGWFQTDKSCLRHEDVMMNKLGTFPQSQRGWLWSFGEIDSAALVESIRRIKTHRWSFPCIFLPELSYEEIPRYYKEHSNTFGHDKCLIPWTTVEILANGDVATCPDFPDYVVGNIKQTSILEMWNNDKYQKFRNHLKTDGLLPVCSRCCGLLGRGN